MDTSKADQPRKYPLRKPDGFVPEVQRYSARLPDEVTTVQVLFLGIQHAAESQARQQNFIQQVDTLCALSHGPSHFDFARYIDPEGYHTYFVTAYWVDTLAYRKWVDSAPVSEWWRDPKKESDAAGYFWESIQTTVKQAETIAFKEYIRGLSACPMSRIEPMGENGYWGGARDRIPASAYDMLESRFDTEKLTLHLARETSGKRVSITPPKNFVVIRSGVSWAECGEEQRTSYQKNIEPKLNKGMEYLRTNPVDTGCCSLRQVEVIDGDSNAAAEEFSLGYFGSLKNLETWAKSHPTHLAIFNRALKERARYKDKLELRTYHEIYVVDGETTFEYVNCHNKTGLLPFFELSGQ